MLKASIIGNLGGDPEMRYSANGTPMLRFNVASNGKKRDSDGTQYDHTEWIQVTVFGARAETLQEYLNKGMRVYVDGKLEANPWTDQQGNVRPGLQVLANEVQFLSPRDNGDSNQNGQQRQQPQQRPANNQQRQGGNQNSQQRQQPQQRPQRDTRQALGLDDPDDDDNVPF